MVCCLLQPAGEVSETASESAWSTDVLASDTDDKQSELLTDLVSSRLYIVHTPYWKGEKSEGFVG